MKHSLWNYQPRGKLSFVAEVGMLSGRVLFKVPLSFNCFLQAFGAHIRIRGCDFFRHGHDVYAKRLGCYDWGQAACSALPGLYSPLPHSCMKSAQLFCIGEVLLLDQTGLRRDTPYML